MRTRRKRTRVRIRTREIIDQCVRCVEFSAGARAWFPRERGRGEPAWGSVRAHVDEVRGAPDVTLPRSREPWAAED
jgi:hypothetical protein